MTMFSSFYSSFRWQDVVDILLNSYILFRLYVLFRWTHVFRVLTVIAILWILQRLAVFFNLILTSWVMQGITAVAALVIIIIFRNEIRSVLQAQNWKAILWGFPSKTVQTTYDIIADSVHALSQRRMGALIVLPAQEELHEFIQNGIPWQGLVSKEMITSIFWPDNPVHDGAAIIQGDQITHVGVILPLSLRNDLPSQYGTRHRAALGLAEATDALIIVVSEETGNIVVAKGNDAINIKNKEHLAALLQEHAGETEPGQDVARQEKTRIALAAVVSVALVSITWFSFSRGLDSLIALEIPVEYIKHDPRMEIVATSANSVNLQLGGSGALIKSVRPELVHVRLDLEKAVSGRNSFTITQDNISLPPGIYVKKVTPSTVEATLDISITKELPVQVDWVGKLADNLRMVSVSLEPDRLEIMGGAQIFENKATIYTEKVPLDSIRKSGRMTLNLERMPASLKFVSGAKEKIFVKYVIQARTP